MAKAFTLLFILPLCLNAQKQVRNYYDASKKRIQEDYFVTVKNLVDDSIVRGTTSKKIVSMVRDAGATEVHMRISCPPTAHSCYYGVDTPHRKDLIAAQMTRQQDGRAGMLQRVVPLHKKHGPLRWRRAAFLRVAAVIQTDAKDGRRHHRREHLRDVGHRIGDAMLAENIAVDDACRAVGLLRGVTGFAGRGEIAEDFHFRKCARPGFRHRPRRAIARR